MTVKLLTIGEFARLARLSPKALRLYDELGLLKPHRVDAWSGYRYYAPAQLERARLVAWLRRLGLPLAQIAAVLDAPRAQAAALVAGFLRVAEADLAERQRLAQFLITYLTEGASPVSDTAPSSLPADPDPDPDPAPALTVRYAAASDTGRVRERNQDAAYASPALLAVADGCGPAGEQASAAAIEALRALESGPLASGPVPADLLNVLSDAVEAASSSVAALARSGPDAAGSASTLTAMLLSGSRLALVHIGDSRAYLFRDGGLFQVTHDHSVTQSMIDAGRLTPEEAASHPQRSLLVRALGGCAEEARAGGLPPEQANAIGSPDLSLLEARAGDRYLLCSDGLPLVVADRAIRETLAAPALSPDDVVRRLITLANEAGGPDNIACAVADVAAA
jgi:protein phosphatase